MTKKKPNINFYNDEQLTWLLTFDENCSMFNFDVKVIDFVCCKSRNMSVFLCEYTLLTKDNHVMANRYFVYDGEMYAWVSALLFPRIEPVYEVTPSGCGAKDMLEIRVIKLLNDKLSKIF